MSCVFCLFPIHSSSSYLSVCMSAYVRMRVCVCPLCLPAILLWQHRCRWIWSRSVELSRSSPLYVCSWLKHHVPKGELVSLLHLWHLGIQCGAPMITLLPRTYMYVLNTQAGSWGVQVQSQSFSSVSQNESTIGSPPGRPALKCNHFKVSHCLTNLTLRFAPLSN